MVGSIWNHIRNLLYEKGVMQAVRPKSFVISIGNLTWGGTGKTSMTSSIAKYLISRGYRVAILSRGYGRKSRKPLLISDGRRLLTGWQNAGDEPFLIAQEIPEAIVAVAKKRADAIPLLESYSPDVVLLDDAFQHRKVARDVDLVMIDASEDILRQRVLPFGKLREPLSAIQRATVVVFMHSRRVHPATMKWAEECIKAPIFHADYVPKDTPLEGKRVAAFCGLGAPRHFFEMLQEAGAELVFRCEFRDHHVYTGPDMAQMQTDAERTGAEELVTTLKDAVKIPEVKLRLPLRIVKAKLQMQEEDAFFAFLRDRLPQLPKAT